MVKSKYKQKGGEIMIKKMVTTLAAAAFVFGTLPKTSIFKGLTNVCSSICLEHDGDGWDN